MQVVQSTQSPRFKRDWEPYSSIAHECSVCARLFDQDADATDATDAILPVWLETSKAKGVEQPLYGNLQCPTHSLGKDNQEIRRPKASKGYVHQIVQDSSRSSAGSNASNKRQGESDASLQALQMNFARVKVLHLQLMRIGRSRQRNAVFRHITSYSTSRCSCM